MEAASITTVIHNYDNSSLKAASNNEQEMAPPLMMQVHVAAEVHG